MTEKRMYKVKFHKNAAKDLAKIERSKLLKKTLELLNILENDPWQTYPPYKELENNLKGFISRRINAQHRIVYKVNEEDKVVKILRMWSHYGDN